MVDDKVCGHWERDVTACVGVDNQDAGLASAREACEAARANYLACEAVCSAARAAYQVSEDASLAARQAYRDAVFALSAAQRSKNVYEREGG